MGGIQSYLWELWRRLPPDDVTVLTTAYPGAAAFDRSAGFRVVRIAETVLLPLPKVRDRIDHLADEVGAELVVLDPALPIGWLGPQLRHRYGVIVHGAEVTVPGRVPGPRQALGRVLNGADVVVAAGGYPAAEGERAAGRSLPVVSVPPGVDTDRFVPLDEAERARARKRFGASPHADLVVSVSRLVPRKGMDVLVEAAAELAPTSPRLEVLVGGTGRDTARLRRLIDRTGAPVRLLGRVDDDDLPALYGCADVFAMNCRNRWLGLEQEGFGIVFLEAAACAVPQIAGDSGGAAEAVAHGDTGLITRDPSSVPELAAALRRLLADPAERRRMGEAARLRAVAEFSYDVLAERLRVGLDRSAPGAWQ